MGNYIENKDTFNATPNNIVEGVTTLVSGLNGINQVLVDNDNYLNETKMDADNITDSVSITSSTISASATAVKTAYDKGVEGLNKANTKENAFTKNTGFNKNKSDSIASTSTDTLATSLAVKRAYDKGVEGLNKANTKENAFTKNTGFNKNKSDSIASTSTDTLATSLAVKRAYDLANSALFDNGSSFATNGYQKLSNGLIIQWGMASAAFNSFVTHSFPLTFPNACLHCSGSFASHTSIGAGDGDAAGAFYISTSQFKTYAHDIVPAKINWVAIGY